MDAGKAMILVAHVLAAVFLAGPFYVLMVVNERAQLTGKLAYWADVFVENYIRRHLTRCCVYNWTAMISGIILVVWGKGWEALLSSWVIPVKIVLLGTNMLIRGYTRHFLQPKIDAIIAEAQGDPVPAEIGQRIRPLRVLRKKLSTICFFNVVVLVILGVHLATGFPLILLPLLILLAVLLTWRVNRTTMPWGWL